MLNEIFGSVMLTGELMRREPRSGSMTDCLTIKRRGAGPKVAVPGTMPLKVVLNVADW